MSDTERKAKSPRKKETFRALRRNLRRVSGGLSRNLRRVSGGLSRKVPRNLLPAVGPGRSDPERAITSPRKLERLRKNAD